MKKLLILLAPLAFGAAASAQMQTAANTAPRAAMPTASSQTAMPTAEAQIIMIRSAMLALSQANVTNNYTVLSGLGSTNFRNANPPAKLAGTFAKFRENRIDMAPVALLQPQQTAAPSVNGGRLRLIGQFPSQPMQVSYDLMFEPEAGQWKLFAIAVNLQKPNGR